MRTTNSESVPTLARMARLLERVPLRRGVKALSVVTAAGMFLVLVMGTLVTNTNSAQGCGNSWPLCKGRFVPDFAISTAIEFSHRAVVAVETILVLALTIGVLAFWRSRREIQILAPMMVVFLFLQAALGAFAVIYHEPPLILALHFGVSLISFASILLISLFILELGGWDMLRDRPIPARFGWMVWGLLIYSYVVVYLGAFVQHTGDQLGCRDWPLCNGSVFPGFSGPAGVVFTHRVAAFVLVAGTAWLVVWARRVRRSRPDLYWGSVMALVCVLAQALEGAFVVYSKVSVSSTLMHGAFVALLFGALCYLAMHVTARPRAVRRPAVRAPDHARAVSTGETATAMPASKR